MVSVNLHPLTQTRPLRRGIRSFVLREGRMTRGQRRALAAHWAAYGLDCHHPADAATTDDTLDFARAFGRRAPLTLEIGFGNGDNLLAMAAAEPHTDFVGIEVYRPGIGQLLSRAAEAELSNLKVIHADAAAVLQQHIAAATFERVLILFPDPWPKRRHHKRRLLTPTFIATLADKMQTGALLHLATDWCEYADSMRELIAGSRRFAWREDIGHPAERPAWRPETRFEARGRQAGRGAVNLLYQRL